MISPVSLAGTPSLWLYLMSSPLDLYHKGPHSIAIRYFCRYDNVVVGKKRNKIGKVRHSPHSTKWFYRNLYFSPFPLLQY